MDIELGPDFEVRALAVARSIHDPLGLQGSVMYKGAERDALFVSEDHIHVYEFTTLRTKEKAVKDAEKLGSMLRDLANERENAYKALTGWFVTLNEPTAEQNGAVASAAIKFGVRLHAISISTLQQRICDSEEYIQCRDNAPFGSIAYAPAAAGADFRVDVTLATQTGSQQSLSDLVDELLEGQRALVVGDFGVGKSHALREVYRALRKEHFKRKKLTPFPVHINLRDCTGLKTPAEILRRHAEEIGFKNERSLISAWRAGACILLLDGFDEVVPVRWLGGASDLKTVRWDAMSPVRRLIAETPADTGIIVCGRSHYFSSLSEMSDALGFDSSSDIKKLNDFTDEQVKEYLQLAQVEWNVPEWIPGRPLLIGYLAAMGELESDPDQRDNRASAWRGLLSAICQRESRMFNAVRPEVIKSIISRVATLARSTGNETGPVGMDLMRTAFIDVNNRQPDEEGMQLLLRLPGLAIEGSGSSEDTRVFVDSDLADVAYGEDLAKYLSNPYAEHPLKSVASWVSASSDLGVEAASDALGDDLITGKAVLAVANTRQRDGRYDSILVDAIRVATALGGVDERSRDTYTVEGVIFDDLVLSGDEPVMKSINFVNCLFQRVDVSAIEVASDSPHFQGGMIGLLDGVAAMPQWLSGQFAGVEIEKYSTNSHTTAGIMSLGLSVHDKIALTVLKKIYGQSGSGRKEGALSRGLDLSLRPLVPAVLASMVSQGWVVKGTVGKSVLYLPVKSRRSTALHALESPGDFRLK
ncbi:NACHT domain-containing protein [Conyzicola sp.]|uniref:NACHT domain-containing protein n=1 Tax=Conyzicola sp. TaxID=1969404 RepID=UPI003989C121